MSREQKKPEIGEKNRFNPLNHIPNESMHFESSSVSIVASHPFNHTVESRSADELIPASVSPPVTYRMPIKRVQSMPNIKINYAKEFYCITDEIGMEDLSTLTNLSQQRASTMPPLTSSWYQTNDAQVDPTLLEEARSSLSSYSAGDQRMRHSSRPTSFQSDKNGQLTVVALVYYPDVSRHSSQSVSHKFSQSIRLLQVHYPHQHRAEGHLVMMDVINFLLRPFRADRLKQVEIEKFPWLSNLRPWMMRVMDLIDVNFTLTNYSTASISMRSWLIPIGKGLTLFLQSTELTKLIQKLSSRYGETVEHFIHHTIVNNMRILTYGRKREKGTMEENHKENGISSHANPPTNDCSDSSVLSSSPSSEIESLVHCIVARRNDSYRVHWLPDPKEVAQGVPPELTWEDKSQLTKCQQSITRFEQKKRCAIIDRWKREQARRQIENQKLHNQSQ